MSLKTIYLISVLIGYVPIMLENEMYQIKLLKEGYNYKNKFSFLKDLLKPVFEGILAFIPIINVIRGVKSLFKIINFNNSYDKYKLKKIMLNDIYNKDINDSEEDIDELFMSIAEKANKDKDSKEFEENLERSKKLIKILSLLEFLEGNNYELDKNFDTWDIDSKLNYLEDVKSKILNQNKTIHNNDTSNEEKEDLEKEQKKLTRKK